MKKLLIVISTILIASFIASTITLAAPATTLSASPLEGKTIVDPGTLRGGPPNAKMTYKQIGITAREYKAYVSGSNRSLLQSFLTKWFPGWRLLKVVQSSGYYYVIIARMGFRSLPLLIMPATAVKGGYCAQYPYAKSCPRIVN